MKITRMNPHTGTERTMDLDVTAEEIASWESGTLAQFAFASLNADEREFIISGVTGEEFNAMFPEEEEDGEPTALELEVIAQETLDIEAEVQEEYDHSDSFDVESAMSSAGMGTDEDYGDYGSSLDGNGDEF